MLSLQRYCKRLSGVLSLVLIGLLGGCASLPDGIEPVQGFDADRYLGTWFEIARLDHRFERDLSQVSAAYSLKADGSIRVLNRGFDATKDKWNVAEGKAKFAEGRDQGFLKVSFFGPFYGSYVVFKLDDDYRHAYVAGNDRSYLWYLSRTPTVTPEQYQAFLTAAVSLGFDTDGLIRVVQDVDPADRS